MARPPRVKSFSYVGFQRYLVTATTHERYPWFADSSNAREIATQIPLSFAQHRFDVVAYCVMPDHVHLFLEGLALDADLRAAASRWKQRTGYEWSRQFGRPLWQGGFHDRVLREAADTRSVVAYILGNPVRAGLVRDARDYPWTGSSRYTVDDLLIHAGQWQPSWKRERRG